MNDLLTMGLL